MLELGKSREKEGARDGATDVHVNGSEVTLSEATHGDTGDGKGDGEELIPQGGDKEDETEEQEEEDTGPPEHCFRFANFVKNSPLTFLKSTKSLK